MAIGPENVAFDAGLNGAIRAKEYQNQAGVVVTPFSAGANVANITGTLTGTTDGAIADVAAIALSTAGGNTYTDAAVNTAVNTAITAINLQLKELQVSHNALLTSVRNAGFIA